MTCAELLGWVAAALMISTFACRDACSMRPLAVATNLAFIGYGALAGLPPVLTLHLVLLPINVWRWAQCPALEGRGRRPRAE
jgi:hypothetical protein